MSYHLLRESLKPFRWTTASLTVDILTVCLYLVIHCDIRRHWSHSLRCVASLRLLVVVETVETVRRRR